MVIDCIIPARAGSKSIPNKNISLLGRYPLLAYAIAAAKLSRKINNIYVSTDSEEFAEIAKTYGAKVLYLRPKNISEDSSMDIDFFKYHINFSRQNDIDLPDLFVNLRPTTPLREGRVIDDAIDKFIADKNSTSLRSAHKINLTPYKMFKRDGNYMRPFLLKESIKESHSAARQLFEDTFVGNGYIDVVDPKLIDGQDVLYGDNIYLYETDTVSDIDGLQDLNDSKNRLYDEKYRYLLDYIEGCKKE